MPSEPTKYTREQVLDAIRTGVRLEVERGDHRKILPNEVRASILFCEGSLLGLCQLLVDKGIVSVEELDHACLVGQQRMAEDLEKYLADCGRPVKLLP